MGEIVKYGIYIVLTAAFVYLMTKSIIYWNSEQTGFSSRKQEGQYQMPSFTLCPWIGTERTLSSDEILDFMSIENVTQAYMNFQMTSKFHRLTDFPRVKNQTGFEVDELWSVHCKFHEYPSANCTPCFTFNAPDDWTIDPANQVR